MGAREDVTVALWQDGGLDDHVFDGFSAARMVVTTNRRMRLHARIAWTTNGAENSEALGVIRTTRCSADAWRFEADRFVDFRLLSAHHVLTRDARRPTSLKLRLSDGVEDVASSASFVLVESDPGDREFERLHADLVAGRRSGAA